MPVYQDKQAKTWYAKCYFTDYTGIKRQKKKGGFKLRREAVEWERNFLEYQQGRPDMTFQVLYDLYAEDLQAHTKKSTCRSRLSLIRNHILPFWKNRKLNEITPSDVRLWQGEIQKSALGEYTKYVVNCHLSTMFNFAVRYYNLQSNPCQMVKTIGKVSRSLDFWTLEEFNAFLPTVQDTTLRVAFLTLFYSGIRCGELFALTVKDFDATEKTITIRGTFHRFDKVDTITTPKSENSKRTIPLPAFLVSEIQNVIETIYSPDPDDRIFQAVTASKLYTAIKNGSQAVEIKRIRVHDLRHSHVSLLINMGFPALLIAERIGDTVEMVNKIYGHLYPNKHREVAEQLEKLNF